MQKAFIIFFLLFFTAENNNILSNGMNYAFDDDDMDAIVSTVIDELITITQDDSEDDDYEFYAAPEKRIRVVNTDVTAALDRAKVTDRQAASIIAAVAQSLGLSLDDICLSASTARRQRNSCRNQLGGVINLTELQN